MPGDHCDGTSTEPADVTGGGETPFIMTPAPRSVITLEFNVAFRVEI